MKKVKVLRIIARLNIGGPSIHAVLLTEGLEKSKYESTLVCGSVDNNEGNMLYYAIEKKVSPYFIPELGRELNFIKDLIAFKKIYGLVRNQSPDIIHTHTAKAGTLGRLAGILYNLLRFSDKKQVRLIHTFHGHVFSGYFNKIKTAVFIYIERFLAKFSCKIITVSKSVKKELVDLKIAEERKIAVIPLGFEINEFLNIPFRNGRDLNIGIIGRLVPIKNHRLFLEAAAKVASNEQYANVKFIIVGDGELRKNLEEYACKLNIRERVEFTGWQKNLARVYSGLDIVALTSLSEGTPVSLIEAMASAKAIVATNVGGVSDILGQQIEIPHNTSQKFKILERGVTVESGDIRGFAEALSFILQNKELRETMGRLGRNYVNTNFSKKRLIKDIEGLYEETLKIGF